MGGSGAWCDRRHRAVIYVADIVVPLKVPLNVPPVNGKNKLNDDDIDVPFLYISLQFIFPGTSNI